MSLHLLVIIRFFKHIIYLAIYCNATLILQFGFGLLIVIIRDIKGFKAYVHFKIPLFNAPYMQKRFIWAQLLYLYPELMFLQANSQNP